MKAVWILLLFLSSVFAISKRQANGNFWWLRNSNGGVSGRLTEENDSANEVEPADNKVDCECVPYYLCINNTISTTGEGLLDIRYDTKYTLIILLV